MEYKFAAISHTTLKVFKFETKDQLLDAIIAFKKNGDDFTSFRYYASHKKWVAFDHQC